MTIVRPAVSELAAPPPFAAVPPIAGEVLAVRLPNHLGDAVMALPAVLQLRARFRRIVAVATPAAAQLAALGGAVDAVVELSCPHRFWTSAERAALAAEHADAALLFNNSLRDAWCFFRSGVPRRCGAAARARSLLLTDVFRLPRRRRGDVSFMHQARVYAAMAEAICGSPWTGAMPELRVTPAPGRGSTLVMAPGAAYGAAKRWPSAYFVKLAERFLERDPARRIALVGSASERPIAAEIAAALPPDRVDDLCGRTPLPELASLLAGSLVCAANDSGVMHLAAALGVPGVAVFGSTDVTATFPVSSNWSAVCAEGFTCSPCLARRCRIAKTPCCMAAVPPDAVADELENRLRMV